MEASIGVKENDSQMLVLSFQINDFPVVLMIGKMILGLVMKIVQFHM